MIIVTCIKMPKYVVLEKKIFNPPSLHMNKPEKRTTKNTLCKVGFNTCPVVRLRRKYER